MSEKIILCIDDEDEIRQAMKAVIEGQGWKGAFAAGIEEAFAVIESQTPDVIILDYHLPKIDGITGTAMLRERLPRVPIIIFTIEDSQEVADRFIEAGASDFAVKPLRAPDIVSRIKVHLRASEGNRIEFESVYTDKGISSITLSLINEYLAKKDEATVEEIADGTGLAYQTVYRYIQFMLDRDMVEMAQSYGKIGRPKRRFTLKK